MPQFSIFNFQFYIHQSPKLTPRPRAVRIKSLCGRTVLRCPITDSSAVVYRPIETVFVARPWHRGRVVLIGDAAHATSPHVGQGGLELLRQSVKHA